MGMDLGVSMPEQQYETQEVPLEQAGDLILLAYAGLARKYESLRIRQNQISVAQNYFAEETDKRIGIYADPANADSLMHAVMHRPIPPYSQKLAESALNHFMLGKAADLISDEMREFGSKEIALMHSFTDQKVRVDNISEQNPINRLKFSNVNPDEPYVVAGTEESASGVVWLPVLPIDSPRSSSLTIQGKRKTQYEIRPLINPEDYTANVKLTFLED